MTDQPDEAAQGAPTGSGTPPPRAGGRITNRRVMLLFSVAAVVLLLISGFAGYKVGSARTTPAEDGADVGFARDMQTHHAQAVQMAMIIRDKTTDPTLRAIADDITTSQQHQAGQMYAWLTQWGLPQTGTDKPMAWMTAGGHNQNGHDTTTTGPATPGSTAGPSTPAMPAPSPPSDGLPSDGLPSDGSAGAGSAGSGPMMGMATPQQIEALQQATGRDAERLFLELMIAHHKGGVAMARAALERAERAEVHTLAAAINTAQAAEINQLQQLLDQRR